MYYVLQWVAARMKKDPRAAALFKD